MATAHKSHRAQLSSLSSDRSSFHGSSSRSSTPLGARDFRLLYAKDSKGHDLSASYPYHSATSSSASSFSESNGIPPSSRDALRLRYAKDAKGHNFADAYEAKFGRITPEEEEALLESARLATNGTPRGARDWRLGTQVVNRYAKDAKGLDVWKTYRY
jgi:hypothetical protein